MPIKRLIVDCSPYSAKYKIHVTDIINWTLNLFYACFQSDWEAPRQTFLKRYNKFQQNSNASKHATNVIVLLSFVQHDKNVQEKKKE